MMPLHKCKDFYCKVFTEDTDFQGVVYHANYLKYFERARSEFLHFHQLSQVTSHENNGAYVVKDLTLNFYFPAKLENNLVVKSEIQLASKARMEFTQEIWEQKNDIILCSGKVNVCYINFLDSYC